MSTIAPVWPLSWSSELFSNHFLIPPHRYLKITSMMELIIFLPNLILFPWYFPFSQVGNLCDPFQQILSSCRTSGCLAVSSTPQIISRTHPVLPIFHCQYSHSGPHLSSLWIRKKLLFDLYTILLILLPPMNPTDYHQCKESVPCFVSPAASTVSRKQRWSIIVKWVTVPF